MTISELSVRKPVTISMIFVLVCVISAIFVPRLGVALYPSITRPVLSVSTSYSNVGPEEMEKNVTSVLESRLSVISGLQSMRSSSSAGSSNISLTFGYGVDLDQASADINQVLSRISNALPSGCGTPVLRRFDMGSMPIVRLTVRGDLPVNELKALAEDKIAPFLERIPGVATASVSGGASKKVRVDVSENRLRAYNLTLSAVASALSARNVQSSGGILTENGINYQIFLNETFNSLEEIRQTPIANLSIPTGSVNRSNVVRLEDISEVYEDYSYSGQQVFIDGVPGLYLSVTNATDANSTTVARDVRASIDDINTFLPSGVNVALISDNTTMITSTMNEVYKSALQGGLLAMLIILVFLRSVKGTLVIGLSMPISILVTLLCMSLLGLTLNMMTMAGLILGIGMIVDSSIVVLDNIHRYRERGQNSAIASILGSKEMIVPITASTLTTICVFLPVIIYKSQLEMLGQMFNDMVITVVISLSVSLIVAITLVPALCGSILRLNTRTQKPLQIRWVAKIDSLTEGFFISLENAYARTLSFVLKNRLLVMTLIILLFLLSVLKFVGMGMSFSPTSSSDDMVTISLSLPEGTNNEVTKKYLFQAQDIITEKVSGYTSLIVTVGSENSGNIQMNLPKLDKQNVTPDSIRALIKPALDDITGAIFSYSAGRGFRSGSPVDISLASSDNQASAETIQKIIDLLNKEVPELTDITSDLAQGKPQYTIKIDRDRAAAFGVSMSAISAELKATLNGIQATTYQSGNSELPVIVSFADSELKGLSDLSRLFVAGKNGKVSLDNLVYFVKTISPRTITREEGVRVSHVTANLKPGFAATKVQPLVEKAIRDNLVLPDSVVLTYKGETQDLSKTGGAMIVVILIAVFLVFIVMAAQFESMVDPLIIFMSIPLLAIGVVWIYVFTGQTFSLFSAVGVIALVGIVVNNGIVLVDYTNGLLKKKTPVIEACIMAGKSRLRPILMTTLTTVIATVPMGFFPGSGGEMMQPIGVTIVGGIASGAILTLFVTPIMYSLFNKRRERRFDNPESLQNMLAEKID
ncbi:MAG TPA: efflux RND transporter permease subunit [Treponemataceae bacterium]|nr:efflux RND transporter permease subunit [Treponemataceae bacterium]